MDRVILYINYVNLVIVSLIFVCLYFFVLIVTLLFSPPFDLLAVVLLLLISKNFNLTLAFESSLLLEWNGIELGTVSGDFS